MLWCFAALFVAHAQEPQLQVDPQVASQVERLVVGTSPVPPFVVHEADGSWKGISIDLWDHIADELDLEYEIREYPVKELVENTSGEIDVAVSLNIAPSTEKSYDMSHAFLSTGLGIAVRPQSASFLSVLLSMLSPSFCCLLSGAMMLLFSAGVVMWIVESFGNEDFKGARGLGEGLLWALETVIGYGDPAHKSLAGRLLAIAWAGFGVVLLTALTAQLSSQLTLGALENAVSGPDDLPKVTVGTVDPSAGLRYCQRHGITCKKYKDAEKALEALVAGEVVAVVYEAPILKYWGSTRWPEDVIILPGTFDNHGYGLGLEAGSPHREQVNLVLLEYTASDEFRALLARYLGSALD